MSAKQPRHTTTKNLRVVCNSPKTTYGVVGASVSTAALADNPTVVMRVRPLNSQCGNSAALSIKEHMLDNIEQIANNIAAACHAIREHCSLHEAANELQIEVTEDDLYDRANLLHLIDRSTSEMNHTVDSMLSKKSIHS